MCFDQKELEQEANNFYKKLFLAQEDTDPSVILDFVPQQVTRQMNEQLSKPYSFSEIEEALFMMQPNSSHGPEGFTVGFYVKH